MSDLRPYIYHIWLEKKIALKDNFVLGRSEGCDYRISDTQVSSKHCRFNIYGNKVTVTDLESHNKTFINGKKITSSKAVDLSEKDIIYIGEQKFIFVWQTEDDFDIPDFSETFSRKILTDQKLKTDNLEFDKTNIGSENYNEIKIIKERLNELQNDRNLIVEQLMKENDFNRKYQEIIISVRDINLFLDGVSIRDNEELATASKKHAEESAKVQEELKIIETKKKKLLETTIILDQAQALLKEKNEKIKEGKGLKKEIKELDELELVDRREEIDRQISEELKKIEKLKSS